MNLAKTFLIFTSWLFTLLAFCPFDLWLYAFDFSIFDFLTVWFISISFLAFWLFALLTFWNFGFMHIWLVDILLLVILTFCHLTNGYLTFCYLTFWWFWLLSVYRSGIPKGGAVQVLQWSNTFEKEAYTPSSLQVCRYVNQAARRRTSLVCYALVAFSIRPAFRSCGIAMSIRLLFRGAATLPSATVPLCFSVYGEVPGSVIGLLRCDDTYWFRSCSLFIDIRPDACLCHFTVCVHSARIKLSAANAAVCCKTFGDTL